MLPPPSVAYGQVSCCPCPNPYAELASSLKVLKYISRPKIELLLTRVPCQQMETQFSCNSSLDQRFSISVNPQIPSQLRAFCLFPCSLFIFSFPLPCIYSFSYKSFLPSALFFSPLGHWEQRLPASFYLKQTSTVCLYHLTVFFNHFLTKVWTWASLN